MKVLVLSVATGLLVSGGQTLATKYSTDRTLRFEMESTIKMETTSMEAERDGEPVEARGGASSETTYEEVHVDRTLTAADGKPTKMRRVFEKVGGTSSLTFGDNTRDTKLESAFQGITLELVDKDGTVEAEVVDGTKPDGENVLEGHKLTTFLDGLLPKDAVDVDGTWDLTKEGILSALRLDVRKALYARPAPSGDSGGEGRGGGRRGGRGGMGGGSAGLLEAAEWKGTAKLVSADKEIDGVACSVVELKLEAAGSRDLPARQGRRGGMFGPESALDNTLTYEIKIEGTLAFANKDKRPVALKLEGTVHQDTRMEFSAGESSMKSHTVQDGKVEYKVAVTAEAVKAEAK
jgi:hypothetical protein